MTYHLTIPGRLPGLNIKDYVNFSWSEQDLQKLIDMLQKGMAHKEIGRLLNKTDGAIRSKAWRMGLAVPKTFTDEEIEIIKNQYQSWNLKEIQALMPNHDKTNICRKAKELGLSRTAAKKDPKDKITDERCRSIYKRKHETEELRLSAFSDFMKKWHAENKHPMLGKHHSQEFSKNASERVRQNWKNMTPEKLEARNMRQRATKIKNGTLNPMVNQSNPYSRTKSGKRKDLRDTFFRSAWEANIARYFDCMKIKWEYEPKTFVFENIKRGSVSYTPDFYLPDQDIWVEIKGWMDAKSITKLDRFKRYFPEEAKKLMLIDSKEYGRIQKGWKGLIEGWE